MKVAEMDAALRRIVDERYARDEAAAKELLTAEEVQSIRANLEAVIQTTVWEWRILHTLEALMAERETLAKALTLDPLQALDSAGYRYRWDNAMGWVMEPEAPPCA